MITKIEAYGIALLVVVLAVAGAYLYGRHDGRTIEQAKWEKAAADAKAQDMESLVGAINSSAQIGKATLEAVGKIKVVRQTINKGIEREIQTNTIYRNDCFPDSGRMLWNATNRGIVPDSASISKSIAGMPKGNGPADRKQSGRDAAAKP